MTVLFGEGVFREVEERASAFSKQFAFDKVAFGKGLLVRTATPARTGTSMPSTSTMRYKGNSTMMTQPQVREVGKPVQPQANQHRAGKHFGGRGRGRGNGNHSPGSSKKSRARDFRG